jgi:hypothetical protein
MESLFLTQISQVFDPVPANRAEKQPATRPNNAFRIELLRRDTIAAKQNKHLNQRILSQFGTEQRNIDDRTIRPTKHCSSMLMTSWRTTLC